MSRLRLRLIAAVVACAPGLPAPALEEPAPGQESPEPAPGAPADRRISLRAWMGGTEPGTSRNALEGQAAYRSGDWIEATAGASWTDNIFYTAYKAFGETSWFYSEFSYLRGAFTWRSYDYTGANRPTPDSNAYRDVPRPELEVSHLIAERVRIGANYQLFLPNFQYDPSMRIVNHKLSGSVEARLWAGLSASVMAALLRDPSPGRTAIKGRYLPGNAAQISGSCTPGDPADPNGAFCAAATSVVYRTELLLGGGLAYDARSWGASVRYIPNRDLDSGFSWSIISGLDLRPVERLSFQLVWIHDHYARQDGSRFSERKGEVYWAAARYQLFPELALGGGLKWVANPGPTSPTNSSERNDGTLLLQAEYRSGRF